METLIQIIEWLNRTNMENPYCDFTVIFLVILGGYFARRYLKELPFNLTYTTLFTGTAFSFIYLLILHLTGHPANLAKGFVSYCIATSCYDLIVKQLGEYLHRKSKQQ